MISTPASSQADQDALGLNFFRSGSGDTNQANSAGGQEEHQAQGNETPETSTTTDAKQSRNKLSTDALSACKETVKLFEGILGFDQACAKQREIVRGLVQRQSDAMEKKLAGKKLEEGEDFEQLSKQLRKENNRLDAQLEGKEALFGKAREAAVQGIEFLNRIIEQVKQLEDES